MGLSTLNDQHRQSSSAVCNTTRPVHHRAPLQPLPIPLILWFSHPLARYAPPRMPSAGVPPCTVLSSASAIGISLQSASPLRRCTTARLLGYYPSFSSLYSSHPLACHVPPRMPFAGVPPCVHPSVTIHFHPSHPFIQPSAGVPPRVPSAGVPPCVLYPSPPIHQYIDPSIYLSTLQSIDPSIHPSHSSHPSIHCFNPSINPPIHPSTHPSTHPSIHLSIDPAIDPSIHLSIHPSIYRSSSSPPPHALARELFVPCA